MAKYVDSTGEELINPDLSAGTLTPKETVHHDAEEAIVHIETREIPGMTLEFAVIDKAAVPAYDEVTVWLYTPSPPSIEERLSAAEEAISEIAEIVSEG